MWPHCCAWTLEAEYLGRELEGLVTRAQSGFYTVETEAGEPVVAQIAGRLKQRRQDSTLIAVGDRVTVEIRQDGTGTIVAVAERLSSLARSRPAPGRRRLQADLEQVLVANPDQLVFVFAIKQPEPSLRKLDRFLVVAELNNLPAVVCINKVDLVAIEEARAMFQLYEEIGYTVLYTSASQGIGLESLRLLLRDRISVFAGSSGVGKTSLLNALQPGLGLKVKQVSQATEKGLHTTRHAELFALDGGGYVADTPGIRGLALFDVEPTELDGYFREMAPLVAGCQFADCSHRDEPNCAIRQAVAAGRIARARYDSYLRLRAEHEELDEAMY